MTELLLKARLMERAQCYEEMTAVVREIVKQMPLTPELRNLLSVAYKNCLLEKRTSWRLLTQIAQKEAHKGLQNAADCANEYKKGVEKEIIAKCTEADIILGKLIPVEKDLATRGFLLKMRADYQRYISELPIPQKDQAIANATRLYDEASQIGLPPLHHISLGVVLNKAIFHYEILGRKEQAIDLLRNALDASATERIKKPKSSSSSVIVNLLEENLRMWTVEAN